MRPIFLFLTTGRCGTQWLATNLDRLYRAVATVTHEPLGALYEPRRHFRRFEQEPSDHPAVVRGHLAWVEQVSRDKTYVETGWPVFATIPLFLDRFGDRVRIVHLVRHLVPTAVSHMVHQCYFGSPRVDDYTQLGALDPSVPGALQDHDRDEWESFTPYERCLYWCTEVHLYGRELRRRFTDTPVHMTRAEDLFDGDLEALRALTDFLELPFDPSLADRSSERVDQWHHRTHLDFDWREIFKHPASVDVCRSLGYELDSVDSDELDRRYRGAPP